MPVNPTTAPTSTTAPAPSNSTAASSDGGTQRRTPPAAGTLTDAAGAELKRTDLGNAERLVGRFGHQMRYCATEKRWYVWDGKRWAVDDLGKVTELAKETARLIYREAAEASPDARTALGEWAVRSESGHRLSQMEKLARTEPGVAVRVDDFDTDQLLLNVANGTLDLRTGQLRAHDPADLLTKLTPVPYDPQAACPRWMQFLQEVLPADQEVHGYLQRLFGYLLTGSVRDQSLFILHGKGSNGKTTILEVLLELLGDYAMPAAPDLLLDEGSQHPTGRADLRGSRVAVTSEVPEGSKLNTNLMKQLTGGDRVKARLMRQDFFYFRATHKFVLAVNKLPHIPERDEGTWRRIRTIPLPNHFPVGQRDETLLDKLRLELPGILAWAVEGCRKWQQDETLVIPAAVRQGVERYRKDTDPIAGFLAECCTLDANAYTFTKDFYGAYVKWAKSNGVAVLGSRELYPMLEDLGLKRSQMSQLRRMAWVGIRLDNP